MDREPAFLSDLRFAPVPMSPPVHRAGSNPAIRLADQPSPPDQDDDREEDEEPSPADPQNELDKVDEASRESFPASDPPAFTPLHIGP